MDSGSPFDWGRISGDYARYRSGPPASFYEKLAALGIGLRGQKILDLGTGAGALAREFARRGALVSGIDASPGQVSAARRAAAGERLDIDFRVAPAEEIPYPAASFDAVTGNQCWHFFDKARAHAESLRVLVPGGLLAVSDFFWISARDPIAARTEELILRYNPGWTGARWGGDLPSAPDDRILGKIEYEEGIPFTRESWRGRVRACRAIGPSLDAERVAAFDAEHAALLEQLAPERFEIAHRVLANVYRKS